LQVWHLSNYIDEMEGEYAEKDPLTLAECAKVAEESLTKRVLVRLILFSHSQVAHNFQQSFEFFSHSILS
jgi:hypothetical protein